LLGAEAPVAVAPTAIRHAEQAAAAAVAQRLEIRRRLCGLKRS